MKRKLVGLIAVTGLAVAGCGSSNSKLSYSAFSQASNKICADANGATASLRSLQPSSPSQLVDQLNKMDGVIENGITQFQSLQGPGPLEAARDRVVSDLRQLSSNIKQMVKAAKDKPFTNYDQASFEDALSNLKALKGRDHADAAKLGAPACGHQNET